MAKRKRSFHAVTIDEANRRGWYIQKVEHQLGPVKKDLWKGDYIALDGEPGSRLIQVTSSGNHAARRKGVLAGFHTEPWLEAGNRFSVWSWRKDLSLKEEEITLEQVRAGV